MKMPDLPAKPCTSLQLCEAFEEPNPFGEGFTFEDMQDYARAYGALVREECAKAADGYADSDWIGSEGARRAAAFIRKDTP